MTKKILFSGIQPSGNLHIGNYIGAISQWLEMQENYNCIFCVVDYHAITVKQNPEILRKKIIEIAKIYLASGIDSKKSIIFQQSDIKEHTELAWILNTITRMSDLNKMTQFKDKAKIKEIAEKEAKEFGAELGNKAKEFFKKIYSEGKDNFDKHKIDLLNLVQEGGFSINEIWGKISSARVGIFDYPVLMAADILLYNTEVVPVGDDQAQHVELTRTLARRFNKQFGEIFTIPELKFRKEGARIMGLDNPEKKMSKSADNELNHISLTDDPAKAKKKIMKAITDSGGIIKYDTKNKPGISNLLTIYSLFDKKSIKEIEKTYAGKGYGDFKKDLALVVAEFLNDFQKKYNKISDKEVKQIMQKGANTIRPIAEETIKKVKKNIGIN